MFITFFDSFREIKNLYDFERKVNFISLHVKSLFGLNYTDEYFTYIEVLINMETLLDSGYKQGNICDMLVKCGLYDLEKFKKYGKMNEETE